MGRATTRRTLRIESLETRTMMHSEALEIAAPPVSHRANSAVEASSLQSRLTLDANGDGRVELSEMRAFLTRWKQRSTTPPLTPVNDAVSPQPDVLPEVADFGGPADWHLNAIRAPEAWAAGHTGAGVTVAVIDTGVDLQHAEIRHSLWTNPDEIPGNGRDDDQNGFVDDIHGWDFAHNDATPQDRNGHGTHVSSLIVGARNGTGSTGAAYGAELMVLQGLGPNGVGDSRDIARAVRYAVDEGADIINISLSGAQSSSLDSALRYANSRGVLVVAAAGNRGLDRPSAPASSSQSLESVLSVGAFDKNEQLASFSNRAGDAVQVVAPGVRLRAAVPGGFALYSGTSMAAPLAAGVAALALSAAPDLSAAQLRDLLVNGASPGVLGDDSHGSVNAAATVAQAVKTVGNGRTTTASLVPSDYSASSRTVSPASIDEEQTGPLPGPRIFTPRRVLDNRRPTATQPESSREERLRARTPVAVSMSSARAMLRIWRADDTDDLVNETSPLEPEAVDASIRSWAA